MVYRVYVEKKKELANEARSLLNELRDLVGIKELKNVRLYNRYDVENIEKSLFDYAVTTVFSEPQLDMVTYDAPTEYDNIFAVEYLPGQFDQRADSAAQCIQIISRGDRPTVRTARVYCLFGDLSAEQVAAIKKYVINPVESREASLDVHDTLVMSYDIPTEVETLNGFIEYDDEALASFVATMFLCCAHSL